MASTDKRKDLPPPSSPQFLDRAREALSTYLGYRGDKLDRGVTLRDLIDGGFAQLSAQFASSGAGNPILPAPGLGGAAAPYVPDLTKPPTPTGLLVTAAISHVVIETSAPVFSAGHGYARTIVYGVKYVAGDPAPTFSDAVYLTDYSGPVGVYPCDPNTTWRIWVTWESVDAVESDPEGGTNGAEVTTGQDVSSLLDALTAAAKDPAKPYTALALRGNLIYVVDDQGQNQAGLFSIVSAPITNNGVTVPAGVYMANAFLMNGVMTNAKIGNLAVDDAKIANMSVAKLTAGSLAVGQYIQSTNFAAGSSGWRINADGTAEFGAASIRGQITAAQIAAGSITANLIDSRGLSIKDASGNVILAAGTALSSSNLGAGISNNLLPNSDFALGIDNWALGWSQLAEASDQPARDLSAPTWVPLGGHTIGLHRPGSPTGIQDIYANGSYIPVVPGARYEFSAYLASHRCNSDAAVAWYDASATYITESHSPGALSSDPNGGQNLSSWNRRGAFATAPANAAYAMFFIRQYGIGQADPYTFVFRPYFGAAGASQTELAPWSASNFLTKINSGNISTYIAAAAIGQAQIGNAAIGTAQIQNAAIGTAQIQNAAIGTAQIQNAAITNAQIANGSISSAQIGAAQIQTANIADLNVDGTKITGVVNGSCAPGTTVYTVSGRLPVVIFSPTMYAVSAAGGGITYYPRTLTLGNGYFIINGGSANVNYAYL